MEHNKKLKAVIPVAIFSLASVILINFYKLDWFDNFFVSVDQARDLYREAKTYQDNGEFKSAYYTYSKISPGYIAYDIVLFQQSKCAASLEDEKTSIKKLETLLFKHKGSPIGALSSYTLGQAYIRIGEYGKAEKQFLATVKNYPDTDFAIGSYYYLGQINKDKNKDTAVEYWLKYISLVPNGRFTQDCIDGAEALKANLTANDKKNIGIALFTAKKYSDAYKYFRQLPVQNSWYYLAKTNMYLRNNKLALYFLKEGIWKYANNVSQQQIQDALTCYVRLSPQSASTSWNELAAVSHNANDFVLINKAKNASQLQINQLYNTIVNNYPNGNYASEALWNLFWNEFKKGDYSKAIQLGKKHADTYTNTRASSKILFWTGKAYEKIGQKHSACEYYSKVLNLYPDSYYAFRSDGRLKAVKTGKDPGWNTDIHSAIKERDSKTYIPYSYNKISKEHGVQVAELINIGDYETAVSIMKKDAFLDSWINLQKVLVSRSIVLARDAMTDLMPKPDPEDKRWRLIYPVFYAKDINHLAHANNLDPILILSLIKEESYFNPMAVSSSNAMGLMQLLPGTAKDIARWNKIGQINQFQLFDPEINIMLGTAYFKYAKDRLNNSCLYAVAGYNGGPGAVEKWLKTIPSNDLDYFIENIPYEQTQNYVKKVYGSYWNYKRIYNF